MKNKAIAAVWTALLLGSAANAGSASLAAPGDCAQPSRDLDTGPLQVLPTGGVAGPPAAHFVPIAVVGDAVSLQPLDLTRTTTPTVDAAGTTISGAVEAGGDVVGTAGEAVGQTVPQTDQTIQQVDQTVQQLEQTTQQFEQTTQQIEQQIDRTTQQIENLSGSAPAPDPTPVLTPTIDTLKGAL